MPARAIDGDLFGSRAALLRAACEGQTFAQLDKAAPALRPIMRAAMPNFFMVLDKLRVDPFTERFPIDFVLEGTVRGTGGLHLANTECWTGVPGLYAAGDVTSREVVVGGATGAGAPNAAWAVASGTWAGAAAARHARRYPLGEAERTPAGRVGLQPSAAGQGPSARELLQCVQSEILPIEKNAFRQQHGMSRSLATLDVAFREAAAGSHTTDLLDVLKLRESVAMLAMARWAYASALARCPTNVFDKASDGGGAPVIARQADCQTCYQCEAYCPAAAIYVAPLRTPAPEGSSFKDEAALLASGELGIYRARVGWGDEPIPDVPSQEAFTTLMQTLRARLPGGAR